MRISPILAVTMTALSLSLFSLTLPADDWPGWRGPSHTGSLKGGDYSTQWSVYTVLWKVPLPGTGASSPAVWNDRILVTSPEDGVDTTDSERTGAKRPKRGGVNCLIKPTLLGLAPNPVYWLREQVWLRRNLAILGKFHSLGKPAH